MSDSIGYTCTCGAENLFDSYAFAHWHMVLNGRCTACGRKTKVLRGVAWPSYRRKTDTGNHFKRIIKRRAKAA